MATSFRADRLKRSPPTAFGATMEPDGQFDYRPFSTIARPLCTRKSSNLQPYDPKSHNAAGELCRLSKECIELALVQGDPTIIGKFVRPVDLSGTFSTS